MRLFYFVDIENETFGGELWCGHLKDARFKQFLTLRYMVGDLSHFLPERLVRIAVIRAGIVRQAGVLLTETKVINTKRTTPSSPVFTSQYCPLSSSLTNTLRHGGSPCFCKVWGSPTLRSFFSSSPPELWAACCLSYQIFALPST